MSIVQSVNISSDELNNDLKKSQLRNESALHYLILAITRVASEKRPFKKLALGTWGQIFSDKNK